MKMVGMRWPASIKRRCRSTPFTPGLRTLVMRQEVSCSRSQPRNSSVEASIEVWIERQVAVVADARGQRLALGKGVQDETAALGGLVLF